MEAKFLTTAVAPEGYPKARLPEIALVGRSNVGKSTLINHLLQRKSLARTSSTPGKTQTINFFSVDEKWLLVDLPGYGFAKVPAKIRREWGPMIQTYLEGRNELKVVLFLFDIRRKPNADDFTLLEWLQYTQTPTLLVLTKADKLKKNQRQDARKQILESLGLETGFLYSSSKNIGRPELLRAIGEFL